jgi:hypothetical protein
MGWADFKRPKTRNTRQLFSGSRHCSKFIKKTSDLELSQRNQSELALGTEETSSDFMMEDKSTSDG